MFWNNKNYINNLDKLLYTCKNKPFIFLSILDWFTKNLYTCDFKVTGFSEMSIYTCFIVCIILEKQGIYRDVLLNE